MTNIKITDLTAYTDAASTDVLPIVDVVADATKKIAIGDIVKAIPGGTADAPGLAFDGDPNTGIWSGGADRITFSTNGNGRLYIDAYGGVGLGESDPSLYNFLANNLVIKGLGHEGISIISGSTSSGNILFGDAESEGRGAISYLHANDSLSLATVSTIRLVITSTGTLMHIGAGNSTTPAVQFNGSAPVNSLVVDASGNVGLGVSPIANTILAGLRGAGVPGLIELGGNGNTVGASSFAIGQDASGVAVLFQRANAAMYFATNGTERLRITSTGTLMHLGAGNSTTPAVQFNGSAPVNSLVIDSSGRVGLGTTSPNYGIDYQTTSTALTSNLKVNAAPGVGNYAEIAFQLWSGAGSGANTFGGSGTSRPGVVLRAIDETGAASGDFVVATFSGGATNATLTEKFRITHTGRVGIGTTSVSSQLHINPASDDNFTNGLRVSRAAEANQYGIFNYSGGALNIIATDSTVNANPITRFYRSTNGSTVNESMRIDGSGRLLVGTPTARSNFYNSSVTALVQSEEAGANQALYSLVSNSTTANGPALVLGKTRGTTVGSTTVVQNGDCIGEISFQGMDGAEFVNGATVRGEIDGTPGANDLPTRLVFSTTADGASSPTPRMTIKSDGNVGLGSSSPSQKLSIGGSGATLDGTAAISLFDGNSAASRRWSISNGAGGNTVDLLGKLVIGYGSSVDADPMTGTAAIVIDSSGRVGIGITVPSSLLSLGGSATAQKLLVYEDGANSRYGFGIQPGEMRSFAASSGVLTFGHVSTSDATTYSEKARIDTSGRLLVGTSTARANIDYQLGTASALLQVERADALPGVSIVSNYDSGTTSASAYLTLARAGSTAIGSTTIVADGNRLGEIDFSGSDGTDFTIAASIRGEVDGTPGANDMPGRLVFSTTADGASSPTERMRITSGGYFKSAYDGNYLGATGTNHEFTGTTANGYTLRVACDNASPASHYIQELLFQNAAPNDSNARFLQCRDSSAARIDLLSNGGIQNYQANDSNLCDEREKKNIETLDSTWGCLKNWELKKFHYNEDADTDDKRYGVIAQQVAPHCPEVITNWVKQRAEDAVLDEDGNVVTPAVEEVVRMGVKEQQMMWMAIKALQEAQLRIETLEAEVAALKGA